MAWFRPDPSDDAKTAIAKLESAVQTLSHDNALLTAMVAHLTEGVVAVDKQNRVLFMNPAMGTLFNVYPEAMKGRLFLEAIRQHSLDELLQQTLRESKPQMKDVGVFLAHDLMFEARAVPLMSVDGQTGALLVLRDITHIRRLEQIRRDFIANVSHELRTPLASIKGFAETLREGALHDRDHAMEFVESIEKHADSMSALVQDLLDLAAIESGQQPPQTETIRVQEMVNTVINELSPLWRKKNIEMKNEIPSTAFEVKADRKHFRQILINLSENAIKFNEAGGWVRFTAEPAGDQLRLIVSDNGPGIAAQDNARIFERFYRADRARSREDGGTGLGLSIVKHLVEVNHGSISVESSVGKGSQFSVFLPVI